MPASKKPASPPPVQGLGLFGCENCRQQHLKCDRVTPTCGRCKNAHRECRQTGIKIRVAKRSFAKKQKWVKTPRRLVFVDETRETVEEATNQDSNAEDYDDDVVSPTPSEELCLSEPRLSAGPQPTSAASGWPCPSEEYYVSEPRLSTGPRSVASPSLLPGASPTDRFIPDRESTYPQEESPINWTLEARNPLLRDLANRVYPKKPLHPLEDHHEAELFRYFVLKMANWLDLCDPARSFETIVPVKAGKCSVLMQAIFTCASRHMTHVQNLDSRSSNKYGSECISYYRELTKYDELIHDENLFAATIILRVWEEMEVTYMGNDCQGYLSSIYFFVKTGGQHLKRASLGAACFWVGLRQEIYIAARSQKAIRFPLLDSLIDHSLEDADDHTWANRAVWHCAEVLNFCFTAERPQSRWKELSEYNEKWLKVRPDTYDAIFEQQDAVAFPEIWHRQSCHVIGIQHHLLATLYLTRLNTKLFSAVDIRIRVQPLVRRICGIGLGNQWTPPGLFTACMAIEAFGDWFNDRRDQDAMLFILEKTEKDHARPTQYVQRKLRATWKYS